MAEKNNYSLFHIVLFSFLQCCRYSLFPANITGQPASIAARKQGKTSWGLEIILASHSIHGIGIFTYMNTIKTQPNGGKYTIHGMGSYSLICQFFHLLLLCLSIRFCNCFLFCLPCFGRFFLHVTLLGNLPFLPLFPPFLPSFLSFCFFSFPSLPAQSPTQQEFTEKKKKRKKRQGFTKTVE